MKFMKLKHIYTTKLIKIANDWTYKEYEDIAIKKFPELEGNRFYITDLRGTVLDDDVHIDYIKHSIGLNESIEITILRTHNEKEHSTSSRSALSIDNNENEPLNNTDSFYCDTLSGTDFDNINMIQVVNSPENTNDIQISGDEMNEPVDIQIEDDTCINLEESYSEADTSALHILGKTSLFSNMYLDDWKTIVVCKGGKNTFVEYELRKIISNRQRIKLVNIMCSVLVEKYAVKAPSYEKENIASIIVQLVLCLRDPMGKNGYEAFFTNRNGGEDSTSLGDSEQ